MDIAELTGQVRLSPGRPLPTITSTRPALASRLATGRAASELPGLLGALFALCAQPHRLAARLAVAAAQGQHTHVTDDDRQTLRLSQVREQVLRIGQDWPRLLPGAPAAEPALLLRSCPLWRTDLDGAAQLAALPAWLEHKWLGSAPAAWLDAHMADPARWAIGWCQRAPGPVAAALRTQVPAAISLSTQALPLTPLGDAASELPALARAMAADEGFCLRPHWHGAVPDTGPWSRHHDPLGWPAGNAWVRLVARVADVLHLAAPGGASWLAAGALPLGAHEGVAWVEMARGLLVHWVRLEPDADGPRVAACRVLAPTEWNFHPRGVLAQALTGLHGVPAATDAARLAVAFDPCVAFTVDSAPGVAHA